MVYETMLTILFAVGIGAAIIVYAARPRQRGASISVASVAPTSAIESFAPAEVVEAAPMPQVTAVETPVAESSAIADVAPAVVVSAAGAGGVPLVAAATMDVSAVAPVATGETEGSPAHAAQKVHRTQRRRSTATKTHARPSSKTTRKH
jgi:hypothetical protein